MSRSISLTLIFLFIIEFLIYGQENNDSIKSISLDEVLVTVENVSRQGDHIVILPTANQKDHSPTGYALLYNLMIPGMTIKDNGTVSIMGMTVGLYINGQRADVKDIVYLRPDEVEKIELYDLPTGKYSIDNMALNFIAKQYIYGGYAHLLGQQSIGVDKGEYQASVSLNRNSITYSVFGGYSYSNLKNIQMISQEEYLLSDRIFSRETSSAQKLNNNNEYFQFQIKSQRPTKYFVGKLAFVGNHIPSSQSLGTVLVNDVAAGLYSSSTNSKSASPKIDLNGEFSINPSNTLTWGVHGIYSHNKYNRLYSESLEEYLTDGREDAFRMVASIIYTYNAKKGKMTAQVSNYYDIYKTHYSGYYNSSEKLWKNESLAFLSYYYPLNDNMSFNTRIGVDWYQYRLSGFSKFNTWNPRLNVRINRKLNQGMLAWSFMLANSNYDTNVLNNAEIQINPFLIRKGNPNLKKSYDIDTYLYYSLPVRKFNITAMLRYEFTKNPVTYSFERESDNIIQTFESKGSNMQTTASVGATWQPSSKLALTGDVRLSYTKICLLDKPHNTNVTGNCTFQWYVGNFQLSPGVSLASTILDRYSLTKTRSPLNYNFKVSYSYNNLIASASIYSPFGKRCIKYSINTPYYSYNNKMLNHQNYKYVNLSLSYLFEFGRKTKYIEPDIDVDHSSSMLRES